MRVNPSRLRRCFALVIGLTVAFLTTVEIQIADVHDGHSVSSSQMEGFATPDGTLPPAGPTPTHLAHVDHCAHAHVAPVPQSAQGTQLNHRASNVEDISSVLLTSESVAPPVPPPVA